MTYDQTRRLPVPLTTSTVLSDNSMNSAPVTTSQAIDDYGNILSFTDPNAIQTTYSYDSSSHLLSSVSQPINKDLTTFVQYARNSQGSLSQIAVKDNHATGSLRAQTDVSYDGYGNPTKVTVKDDSRNIVIDQEYENVNHRSAFITKRTVKVSDPDGVASNVSEQMQYDIPTGLLLNYTDGKGFVTSYKYDKLGRVNKATYADTSTVTLSYDDVNNKITAVDQTGLTTVEQWNGLGWKVSEGISGSGALTYGYDQFGRVSWSKDALGNKTSYEYDAWNRSTKTIPPDGLVSTISYDDVNRTVTLKDAESNVYREIFDILGRTLREEWLKPTGTITLGSYSYDYSGNKTKAIDGNSYATTYSYDALGRLISVTDPDAKVTSYAYSLAGQLSRIQYADGNQLSKQYDERGRLIKQTDSSGLPEKYYYDANDNIVKYTDRKGKIQTIAYNNRNFMINNATASETITYSYDLAGRRLSMKDNTGTTSYTYDPTTKLLKTVTYPDDKVISYVYDNQGNRTRMTDVFGLDTYYGYDSRNRLKGVGPAANNWDASYNYKGNNLLSTTQYRNGVVQTNNYDGMNLTSLIQTGAGGTTINTFSYSYDNVGNQLSKTESNVPYSFGYDKLNRILTSSQFNETYSYDSRGNRKSYSSDKAIDISSVDYVYDDRDRLIQAQKEGGKSVAYRYNGDGMLYERIEDNVTTRFYYDGTDMIAEATVTNGVASLKAKYIRGNSLIARQDAGGNKLYYLHNGHGDVVGLADGTGKSLNQYSYDIWGKPIASSETVSQPFRYSGEYWDNTTELQYLRARWYDPAVGRFINEDTYKGDITNPLTLNLYTYVHNNPLIYADPSGHKPEIWYDKEKKEYSYAASVRFLDGTLVALGYIPFSSIVLAGSKALRDSVSNKVYSEISKQDINKAKQLLQINTELNLLDILGGLSSSKIKNAVGNIASVVSFVFASIDAANFMFESDISWLVEDLVSPGLMVSNRREQITLRYYFASELINDMIKTGALKYSYNDKGQLTHNLTKAELDDINNAVLNFMIATGAYDKKGDY